MCFWVRALWPAYPGSCRHHADLPHSGEKNSKALLGKNERKLRCWPDISLYVSPPPQLMPVKVAAVLGLCISGRDKPESENWLPRQRVEQTRLWCWASLNLCFLTRETGRWSLSTAVFPSSFLSIICALLKYFFLIHFVLEANFYFNLLVLHFISFF